MTFGSYRVIRQISEGAFGRTFYAEHALLKTPVCIKQEKTKQPELQKIFREEARLLWDVRHVSLPTLKEYLEFPDHGQLIVMSYIPGENLQELVEKKGPVDDEHICWILQRLLDAVSYLHYKKIIHCDIKPQNTILEIPEHNAILVDFGLAFADPDAASHAKGGTPFYMPPEFRQGLPPIPQSDIYALGMTAVFLAGGNVGTGTLPKDMYPELRIFVEAMIRQDPMARPSDAGKLNHELGALRKRAFGRSATREAFKFRKR